MNKAAFKLIELGILVEFGECRKIVVGFGRFWRAFRRWVLDSHNAELIHRQPLAVIIYTIAKGEKATSLPTELGDEFSRFCGFIEVLFQFLKLFLFSQPNIVAQGLHFLTEAGKGNKIFLSKFDSFLMTVFVGHFIQTNSRLCIFDMIERLHREVRPNEMSSLLVQGVVTMIFYTEAEFL